MSSTWIITFVVGVVAICAGLAALGFRGRITTVGIDLGTTFSVVGINKNGKIIIIEDNVGHRIFPSVVSYQDNGDILAAYEALPHLNKRPLNTIYNAKRFIGRSLDNEDVQKYASEHPFRVVQSSASNFSQVGFEIDLNGRKAIVSPEDVGTQVLKFLLRITSQYLRHNQVNKAVVAVPAKFDANQRRATGECYKRAGLKVVRVIEEPTAAAVAYKLHKKSNVHHILVYDFGGGTLDVSLLYVSKGSVQVYATDGDETLGGSDLDLCIAGLLKTRVRQRSGVDVDSISAQDALRRFQSRRRTGAAQGQRTGKGVEQEQKEEVTEDDLCLPASIHGKAEELKKALTSQGEATFRCTLPSTSDEDKDEHVAKIEFPFTRREFEEGCAALFERGLAPVSRLLGELQMDKNDVDEVVLVGGSTRVPLVKQQLREFFGKELNDHIDPDVTVAYGAASILD